MFEDTRFEDNRSKTFEAMVEVMETEGIEAAIKKARWTEEDAIDEMAWSSFGGNRVADGRRAGAHMFLVKNDPTHKCW